MEDEAPEVVPGRVIRNRRIVLRNTISYWRGLYETYERHFKTYGGKAWSDRMAKARGELHNLGVKV